MRYYHTDPNGLPQQLTEDDGRCIWQASYQVWGNTLAEQQESFFVEEQNLRFQGQYLDRETGLHYNTFRFYDPDIGRFISPDPIGLAGGINLFQYAPEPYGWVDPWGWVSNNPGVYDVFGEARLPKDMYRLSDYKHFQESNRQLYYQMKNNPSLMAQIESKYPGTFAHVSPGKRGAFKGTAPASLTWHHHENVGGLLQLVDSKDHNSRHKDYHPSGRGGRNKWGGGSICR